MEEIILSPLFSKTKIICSSPRSLSYVVPHICPQLPQLESSVVAQVWNVVLLEFMMIH